MSSPSNFRFDSGIAFHSRLLGFDQMDLARKGGRVPAKPPAVDVSSCDRQPAGQTNSDNKKIARRLGIRAQPEE
jgi:hypothetical protein